MQSDKYLEWLDYLQVVISGDDPTQSPRFFLPRARELFKMGSAFIYETDHNSMLHLRDFDSDYGSDHLPRSIDLREALGGTQYIELMGYPMVARFSEKSNSPLGNALSKVFSAQSYIICPILEKDGIMSGLVGFADRRGGQNFDEQGLRMLELIVGAIVSRVRLRKYNENLISSQRALKDILDNVGVDICVNDFYTDEVLYANESMAAAYGGKESLIGRCCWEELYGQQKAEEHRLTLNAKADEEKKSFEFYDEQSETWWQVVSATLQWTDGRKAHVMVRVDISEEKRNQELIRDIAERDVLTGLPNRYRLDLDIFERERAFKSGTLSADAEDWLIFFDLDGFKNINDTYGHQVGDLVLKMVGEFVLERFPEHSIYRYGGDEFLVWCKNASQETAEQVLDQLNHRFTEFWGGEDDAWDCRASFGMTAARGSEREYYKLIEQADRAMYLAKSEGPNSACIADHGEFKKIR